ncbi:MAG: hypothetical protein JXB10_07100 [Pirellulales bacterium]|nr:hypothetical protein [Pirellulales bacterium]
MKNCRYLIVFFTVLLAAGCSSRPPAPPYDSKRAREILILVLDAWKENRVGTLARRTPPVRFEDEDCRNGLRLTDYRIAPDASFTGPFDDVTVTLLLLDRRGNKLETPAAYQIALQPRLSVLRND